ncbi:PhzF family phenazine biosynthesis protein [Thalassospiraceae bacterium LMO-JJ14]|nr:PhzF family phenazine biosynthesis protein [Thalassospiraceae bacterium LMO-JJ14]
MTTIPLYQLDAFTDRPFGGNPAAVCPLDEWLPDDVMQSIALENNLSETAFYVPEGNGFRLRWFTPEIEVDLCGHATLATGALILEKLDTAREEVAFETRSGTLGVRRNGDMLVMDFPALAASDAPVPDGLEEALGASPVRFLRAVKNMAVFEKEADVLAIRPDFDFIKQMDGMGLIITAPGDSSDCASRYFAPHAGINEDPVTGSAHCTIVPYWADILGKDTIHARQVSARSGDLYCRMSGARVEIGGKARLVVEGTFRL